MRVHFDLDTRATPAQVREALTDVGDRRLEIWSRTLDPARYEVRDQGEGWAVVREGSAGVPFWVLLRYEWPDPDLVTWTLLDSDHCDRGTGQVRVTPRDDGGSHVDVVIHHSGGRGLRGRAVLLAQRLVGPVAFARMWRAALDGMAG